MKEDMTMKKLFEMPTVEVEVLVSADAIMSNETGSGVGFGEDGAGYWN